MRQCSLQFGSFKKWMLFHKRDFSGMGISEIFVKMGQSHQFALTEQKVFQLYLWKLRCGRFNLDKIKRKDRQLKFTKERVQQFKMFYLRRRFWFYRYRLVQRFGYFRRFKFWPHYMRLMSSEWQRFFRKWYLKKWGHLIGGGKSRDWRLRAQHEVDVLFLRARRVLRLRNDLLLMRQMYHRAFFVFPNGIRQEAHPIRQKTLKKRFSKVWGQKLRRRRWQFYFFKRKKKWKNILSSAVPLNFFNAIVNQNLKTVLFKFLYKKRFLTKFQWVWAKSSLPFRKKFRRYSVLKNYFKLVVKLKYNNTIIYVYDAASNFCFYVSGGMFGKGKWRGSFSICRQICSLLITKLKALKITHLNIQFEGYSYKRRLIFKALQKQGFFFGYVLILSLFSHNGCRQKKIRR